LLEQVSKRVDECKKDVVVIGKKVTDQWEKCKALKKKNECGALTQAVLVRQQIEQLLEEMYNMLRSSYHGGDFEGNHCQKLKYSMCGRSDGFLARVVVGHTGG